MQSYNENKSPFIVELAVELYNKYSTSLLETRTLHLSCLKEMFAYHSTPFHILEAAHLALSWKEQFGENAEFIQ
jgi:hypothetical protein